MDVHACLIKLLPGFKGVTWNNNYKEIKPDITETRAIPPFEEFEAVWPEVEAEIAAQQGFNPMQELLIQKEMEKITREQAIANLKASGIL